MGFPLNFSVKEVIIYNIASFVMLLHIYDPYKYVETLETLLLQKIPKILIIL